MTIENNCLQAHEEFSLTGKLLEVTQKWDQKTNLGFLGTRLVNLTCTPFTALIDAVAHLALGALSICGLSQLGMIYNGVAYLLSSEKRSPITFTGGLINLAQGLKHASAILILPFLAAASPESAADHFKHRPSVAHAKLRLEIQKAKNAEAEANQAKQHVINNVKAAFSTVRKQNGEISQKKQQINKLKNKVKTLKGKIAVNSKNEKEATAKLNEVNRSLLEKIAALEAQNSILVGQNTLITNQNALLEQKNTDISKQNEEMLDKNNQLAVSNQKLQAENVKLKAKTETLTPSDLTPSIITPTASTPQGLRSWFWNYFSDKQTTIPSETVEDYSSTREFGDYIVGF